MKKFIYDFTNWQDLVTFANEEALKRHPNLISVGTYVTLEIETEEDLG